MTVRRTRPVRLRLTFNYRSGNVQRERIRGFASVLVQDVAINAAEDLWRDVKSVIEQRVAIDVAREITHMAQLYKQYIIGISGDRVGPHGKLTTAAQPAKGLERMASYNLRGSWARRNRHYLKAKRKAPPRGVGHNRWFEHDGVLKATMGKKDTWTTAFGPVQVQVTRSHSMSTGEATNVAKQDKGMNSRFSTGLPNPSGSIIRVHVANVRAAALGAITPRMLPAIQSGDIDDMAPDGRTTGLIGRFPREISWALGGNEKFVPYRHTVEPFLGFVLTRAIPNAVARRIQESLGADIRQDRTTRSDRFSGRSWGSTSLNRG